MIKNRINEIIIGCVNKNPRSQTEMYNLLHSKMHRYVLNKMNNDYFITEEIVNDGFIRLFDKINQYNYTGNFEGWARTIFHSAIMNYINANKKHMDRFTDLSIDVPERDNSLSKLYYQDLMCEIEKLSEIPKKIFDMFIFECKTHKEISEILGISVGTSKWHIYECRKQLVNKINQLKLTN